MDSLVAPCPQERTPALQLKNPVIAAASVLTVQSVVRARETVDVVLENLLRRMILSPAAANPAVEAAAVSNPKA